MANAKYIERASHMNKTVAAAAVILIGLATGEAAYWFIGGAYQGHTQFRNGLVAVQFLVGVVAMAWLALRTRRSGRQSKVNA
jgi:hypothetical protein